MYSRHYNCIYLKSQQIKNIYENVQNKAQQFIIYLYNISYIYMVYIYILTIAASAAGTHTFLEYILHRYRIYTKEFRKK